MTIEPQRYFADNQDYPYAPNRKTALRALRDKTRGVILQDTKLSFDRSNITLAPDYNEKALLYWADKNSAPGQKRRKPGETTYSFETSGKHIKRLTPESIAAEAEFAGMVVKPEKLHDLYKVMMLAMTLFSGFVKEHTKRDFKMRAWQIWSPPGGQGRTPLFHPDDTAVTGLLYVGKEEDGKNGNAEIYTGEITEDLWRALVTMFVYKQMQKGRDCGPYKAAMSKEGAYRFLEHFGNAVDPQDLIAAPSGSVMITRNFLDKNSNIRPNTRETRETICVHRSSVKVKEYGQVGLIMVPEFIKS